VGLAGVDLRVLKRAAARRRRLWLLAASAAALLAASFATSVMTAQAAGGSTAGAAKALERKCLRLVLSGSDRSARAVPGSAGQDVLAQFAALRDASGNVTLPGSVHLAQALGASEVTSYDPSRLVELKTIGQETLYAVPATIAKPTLPPGCAKLPKLAGIDTFLAGVELIHGVGPGACLLGILPATTAPVGAGSLTSGPVLDGTDCESSRALAGYAGVFGSVAQHTLIPDGIDTLQYAFADGRKVTASVSHNLVESTSTLNLGSGSQLSRATLTSRVEAALPTSITESGPGPYADVTYPRPSALVVDAVGAAMFVDRLAELLAPSSSSGSGSTIGGTACSRRTHRCVTYAITTTCGERHCSISRRIRRFRYEGNKLPTFANAKLPALATAPIVGKASIALTKRKHLQLALAGAPRKRVAVFLSIDCVRRNTAAVGGGPTLYLAVPSRTAIPASEIPGPGKCVANVLVTSTTPGPVSIAIR
jgi:hypothetical protein